MGDHDLTIHCQDDDEHEYTLSPVVIEGNQAWYSSDRDFCVECGAPTDGGGTTLDARMVSTP